MSRKSLHRAVNCSFCMLFLLPVQVFSLSPFITLDGRMHFSSSCTVHIVVYYIYCTYVNRNFCHFSWIQLVVLFNLVSCKCFALHATWLLVCFMLASVLYLFIHSLYLFYVTIAFLISVALLHLCIVSVAQQFPFG